MSCYKGPQACSLVGAHGEARGFRASGHFTVNEVFVPSDHALSFMRFYFPSQADYKKHFSLHLLYSYQFDLLT